MVQILPQAPSLGELLGSGVSTGLQTVLQQKMQMNKLKNILNMGMSNQGNGAQQGDLSQALAGQQGQPGQQMQPSQQFQLPHSPQQIMGAEVLGEHGLASAWQHDNDMAMKQHELDRKEKRQTAKLAFEETKDTRKSIDTGYKSAIETNQIINRMEELDKQGVTSKEVAFLFDKMGLPISILKNPNSEEFQKLQQQMMKGVTQYGSRILQIEFDNFMKQIPTLLNSKEGRSQIYRNIKLMNQINLDSYQAKKDIIRENGGTPPMDLFDQIQERIAPKLDEISKKMTQGAVNSKIQQNPPKKGFVWMRFPDGQVKQAPENELEKWKNLGGELVQ